MLFVACASTAGQIEPERSTSTALTTPSRNATTSTTEMPWAMPNNAALARAASAGP